MRSTRSRRAKKNLQHTRKIRRERFIADARGVRTCPLWFLMHSRKNPVGGFAFRVVEEAKGKFDFTLADGKFGLTLRIGPRAPKILQGGMHKRVALIQVRGKR